MHTRTRTHTHTRARTHTHTHARTRARLHRRLDVDGADEAVLGHAERDLHKRRVADLAQRVRHAAEPRGEAVLCVRVCVCVWGG